MKKHAGFILFFSCTMFIFLGDVIFMRSSFIDGDYLAQFYPWSKIYSEAIKNFSFPFWTRYFNSGFPLMAEGQIGGFYPLNIIIFFLLPFKFAYNYSIILHFVLAGVFTYIYARKIGADQWGGSLAALLFCFGSAYAGCFYNTVVVRTVVWFPLVLYLFEKYFDQKAFKYMVICGIILGMQLLAGFIQMAFYSAIFYSVYFISGLLWRRDFKFKEIVNIGLLFIIAGIIFLPQFKLSWPLSELSSRQGASLGFALWGSLSPFNFMSLCFPYWIFQGTKFYIGIFAILFLITAILALKEQRRCYSLFLILVLSVFLALGEYNPVYVFLLKISHFYGLRNPSKIIFFANFCACVLSGIGFTQFFSQIKERQQRSLRIFGVFISVALGIFFLAKIILYLFKDAILGVGKWYVLNNIAGKEYHRQSLELYLAKVDSFYQQFVSNASLLNPFVRISVIFCLGAMLVSVYLNRKNSLSIGCKYFFIALIFIDIFIFSFYGTGFRGNIRQFDYLQPSRGKIIETIKADKELFRIMPFGLSRADFPWWARPNTNILIGVDSIASYAPLMEKSYKDALSSLEIIDDSLGLVPAYGKAIIDKQDSLHMLNVKYIISTRKFQYTFLDEIVIEGGIYLYKLKDYLPRLFFADQLKDGLSVSSFGKLMFMEYRDGFSKVEVLAERDGFLVFSENYYPGWDVYVDEKKDKITTINGLIQAVKITKGYHRAVFKFSPRFITEGDKDEK